jgi:dTMP kinase
VPTARGRFITFEGLDGTGKSTQMAKLAKALRARGLSVIVTREPGGTQTGEKIRHVILDSATTKLDSMAEMALMFASRAQHIAEVIEPALAAGKIVLCDRFTDSTEAYQGGGRKLGSKPVLALHRILCRDLRPDLTILLEFDLATSIARARQRNQAKSDKNARSSNKTPAHKDENRFEQENQAFFHRVRSAYQAIARRESSRVIPIDARGTPAQTHSRIFEAVRRRLKLPS